MMALSHASAILLILLSMLIVGCYRQPPQPNLPRIFSPQAAIRRENKSPVIVIPALLGSRLVNRRTGQVVWPDLVVDSKALALPIASTNLAKNTDDLVATEIVDSAKLMVFLPEIHLYDALLEALERYGGYRRGNFDNPPADGDRDTFYVFPYDWRRDLTESARQLGRQIATLKQRLGKPDLRFDVIGHSAGGLVARYWAMYGDRDVLDESVPQPDWSGARDFSRLVLIATPNAGTMTALRILLEGYSAARNKRLPIGFLDKLKNKLPITDLSPRVAFASPSIYQLLPAPADARFFDAQFSPLTIDLYDIETWRRYNWSVAFDNGRDEEQAQQKRTSLSVPIAPSTKPELEAEQTRQERFLRAVLDRALGFHRALAAASVPPDSLRLYLIGGDCYYTLNAAMIVTDTLQRPRTLFQPEKISRDKNKQGRVLELMYEPGDGSTTRNSLFGQLLDKQAAKTIPSAMQSVPVWTAFFCDGHAGLPLNPTLQNNLLTALLVNAR